MKIKKTIITTAIVLMVSYVIKVEFIDSNELTADKIDTDKFIAQTKAQSKFKGDVKLKTKTKPIALAHINPLFEQLQPPADRDLEDLWQQEYGCYDQRDIENNEIKYDKKLSAKKLDDSLLYIARIISPASDQQLKDSWQDEYTCEDKVTSGCEKSIFNARSYEDALWLKRKGYLTRSMLELLTDISKRDLHELSKHGNLNAKNLLAINALNDNDLKNARKYAISSTAFSTGTGSRETFGYLILAQSYIEDKQPMMGALYLRIASLLGDTNAADQYQQLTAQTAATVIDDINLRAFSVLLTALNTHISNWDNDPRPRQVTQGQAY